LIKHNKMQNKNSNKSTISLHTAKLDHIYGELGLTITFDEFYQLSSGSLELSDDENLFYKIRELFDKNLYIRKRNNKLEFMDKNKIRKRLLELLNQAIYPSYNFTIASILSLIV